MKELHMADMLTQDNFDESHAELRGALKALRVLARASGKAADEACKEGKTQTSCDFRMIEAKLFKAIGEASEAYSIARGVGEFTQKSGDK